MMDVLQKLKPEMLVDYMVKYSISIGTALLVLVVGWFAIKYFIAALKRIMQKREVDPSVIGFALPLIRVTLKIVLVVTVVQRLGIETTSFVAVLGAAGLAIGLALQGTLSNFAGGVIILVLKPFRVGDFIEAQGYTGTVFSIKLFTTVLKTTDNKTVIIPNGALANGNILNFTHEPTRRVDWLFSISYGNDAAKAIVLLQSMLRNDNRILTDPEPFVAIQALGHSSVDLVVRAWVNTENYWPVFFDLNRKVYEELPKAGFTIPFPQLDVHLSHPK